MGCLRRRILWSLKLSHFLLHRRFWGIEDPYMWQGCRDGAARATRVCFEGTLACPRIDRLCRGRRERLRCIRQTFVLHWRSPLNLERLVLLLSRRSRASALHPYSWSQPWPECNIWTIAQLLPHYSLCSYCRNTCHLWQSVNHWYGLKSHNCMKLSNSANPVLMAMGKPSFPRSKSLKDHWLLM